MIVNKKMKNRLTQANIDPYSSEGRYGRRLLSHIDRKIWELQRNMKERLKQLTS